MPLLYLILCTILFVPAFVGEAGPPPGETWRSELYGEHWQPPGLEKDYYADKMLQDYSYAGYRLGEPIPDIEAPVFGRRLFNVAESPYNADPTGAGDSTAAIQQAIDDAGETGRGVVYLPEGTYRVSAGSSNVILRINNPEIVLRGAGVGETFILNTTYDRRRQRIISVSGPSGSWREDTEPAVAIPKDLMGPTRVIPVENTDTFSVGDWIILRTDTTVEWVDEHHEPDWRDHAGTHSQLNGLAYYRQIVAINEEANTLLIDIPTRYAIKTRDAARVHRAGELIHDVGLEDFSIGNIEHPGTGDDQWSSSSYNNPEHHAYELHGSAAIGFARARDCWVRNVHSFRPEQNGRDTHLLTNGVTIGSSRSLTLENVHMQRPLYGGGGGNGYMFRVGNSSEILFRQCLASHNRHGFVFSSMSTTGNVIHDSKDRHTNTQAAGTGHAGGANSDHHMFFSHSNLVDHSRVRESMFEARYRPFTASPQHNITAAHSTFWNTMGLGGGDNAVRSDQARYGYVIGTRGLDGSRRYGVVLGDGSLPQTTPIDHVEGVGEGATLYPQSLYVDQLEKRRTSIRLELMQADPGTLPSNAANLAVHPTIGADLEVGEADLAWEWSLIDGPGNIEFTDPNSPETRVLMEKPGTYRVKLTASAGEENAEITVPVTFSPYSAIGNELEEANLSPTDDAHVQVSAPGSNFGGSITLQAKALGNTNERQVFLRFDLSDLDGFSEQVVSAKLLLRKTVESTPHTAALYSGSDSGWTEDELTYENRPVADVRLLDWPASGAPGDLELEVASAVRSAFDGDGWLTLRLVVLEQSDSSPLIRYASKEHSEPEWHPRLKVRLDSSRQSYEQWADARNIPEGERDPAFDRFGFGVSNLVAYLTGIPAAHPAPAFISRNPADGAFRVEFPWRTSVSDNAWFLLQKSDDLVDWLLTEAVEWSTVLLDDDRALIQGELPREVDDAGLRFLRIKFFLEE